MLSNNVKHTEKSETEAMLVLSFWSYAW